MVRSGSCPDGVAYTFLIGPKGEFGIEDDALVVLHESVEGWVEALALADHAVPMATRITKVVGEETPSSPCTPAKPASSTHHACG
ncbi:hypothetical protein OG205_26850 [Lentzea sp. NBC_00516]|uniref:hypothetical protein n=1 Tax=Lentzea sp. NBC_00516 TaxID=2903582 RepID=UPI002E803AEA|nr:hypothetical protein [Lentzea sp. NBC_00516]WUD21731.1 hypothetical protein OG205_26850 [Lentzea sp. NBC_00516]